MKRTICNILILVLLLTLAAPAVNAGGGATVVWEESFSGLDRQAVASPEGTSSSVVTDPS